MVTGALILRDGACRILSAHFLNSCLKMKNTEIARAALVTVPAWFTVGDALKVAEAKGCSHVGFYDQQGHRNSVSLLAMQEAPETHVLAGCVLSS